MTLSRHEKRELARLRGKMRRSMARRDPSGYRVAYLTRGVKTFLAGEFALDQAKRQRSALARRGFTAWVTDIEGQFVPVPGAKREPGHVDRDPVSDETTAAMKSILPKE